MDTDNNIFEIPKCNMGKFRKKITLLQKRAKKINVEIPKFEIVGERLHRWTEHNIRYSILYIQVQVFGIAPKIAGWEFVGTIEHNETGNIIRTVPTLSQEISTEKYRDVKTSCDHCKTSRYRKETFLVLNESTKKILQVGRSCLKDFMGHASPEYYALLCHFILEISEKSNDEYLTYSQEAVWNVKEILSCASMYISKHGYVPASSGRGGITSAIVKTWLTTSPEKWKETFKEDKPKTSERDLKIANKVFEFILGLDKNKLNDFEHNMNATVKKEYVVYKDIGLITYMIEHYRREVEKVERFKKQQKIESCSNFIGKIKERLELELTFIKGFNFGWCDYSGESIMLYKFKDTDGNIFCWKTTKDLEIYPNDVVKLKGTVKDHSNYNDINQTILTRCKVNEIIKTL